MKVDFEFSANAKNSKQKEVLIKIQCMVFVFVSAKWKDSIIKANKLIIKRA